MSDNKIVFSSVKVRKGLEGSLQKDENGYYRVPLGALNIFNSAGAYYTMNGAKELFESSSSLMRRINNGALKAELGHPKKAPGMTMSEYMNRIISIDINNIGAHIKSVELVETNIKEKGAKDNRIDIIGWIKPNGPKAQYLTDLLEDPDANFAFSIRSLTNDSIVNGVVVKVLKQIITWDIVIEPGLHMATKWKSLGIESMDLLAVDFNDKDTLKSLKDSIKDDIGIGTEDNNIFKHEIAKEFDCKKNGSCILHSW